ncbi:UDP-N-acetylglucosamine transferase subunit alg14-like [Varroa destructor]|uniref:UDP-N-acetylglucosamine transferase subunit ALG14 n=1 Tax=Varroa destructor TaxID=109461 RepID=A0A7M7JV54_VARDE|nr:UDP-N-acetylglucosamine transferase subunit alg14-like [Varroa destructor]
MVENKSNSVSTENQKKNDPKKPAEAKEPELTKQCLTRRRKFIESALKTNCILSLSFYIDTLVITENLPLYRVIFYGYIKKNNYIYIYINVCVGRRKDYVLLPISRIREVHQSLLTVPFTAALPLFQAPFILLWHRPDVLVANGPGICIPLILWSFVFAVFCLKRPVIIFVESFCRVQTLSLTARFMKPFVDRLIVQWRPLHESYKKATRYHGLLV